MKTLEFQRKLRTSVKPVIVDIWAPWCKPCRAMEPTFKQVSENYKTRVEVLKINADESPEVLKSLKVMSIPTVLAFSGDTELIRRTGMQTSQSLQAMFDVAVNREKPAVMPIGTPDRILRILAAAALLLIGWFANRSIPLMVLGGLVLFTAFYDRCPIVKAIMEKFKSKKSTPNTSNDSPG